MENEDKNRVQYGKRHELHACDDGKMKHLLFPLVVFCVLICTANCGGQKKNGENRAC